MIMNTLYIYLHNSWRQMIEEFLNYKMTKILLKSELSIKRYKKFSIRCFKNLQKFQLFPTIKSNFWWVPAFLIAQKNHKW